MVRPIEDSGESRQEHSHNLIRRYRAPWTRFVERLIAETSLARDTFTADDVRDRLTLPPDINPVLVGSCFKLLSQAGVIEYLHHRKSRRIESHARPVAVWRTADVDAVNLWLATNPPLPFVDDVRGAGPLFGGSAA